MTKEEFNIKYGDEFTSAAFNLNNNVINDIINEDFQGICLKDGDTDHEYSTGMILKKRIEKRLITT